MTETQYSSEPTASALGRLAREGMERRQSPAAARARMLARIEHEAARRAWPVMWLAMPAVAVLAAVALWWTSPRPLTYEVAGDAAHGPYVSAPSDRALSLSFSDASRIELSRGSQLRVEGTSPNGARVLLERGSATVHVAHREQAEWTFLAGPCEVHVLGTRFELRWDPPREVFELSLKEGLVEIQTPLSPKRVSLRAGQVFSADLAKRRLLTAETGSTAGNVKAAAVVSPAQSEKAAAEEHAAAHGDELATRGPKVVRPDMTPARALTWQNLMTEGRFEEVLEQAEQRGTASCLKTCTAADLSALSDAARYSGKRALAEQSLRSLRSRFPADSAGRSAAFMLGRLHEERGSIVEAKQWYERYLNEAPGGTYAAEALAGKMRATQAAAGRAAAASAASEYLRLYPKGIHAKTARAILGTP